jgi:uncharacterized protein
MTTRIPAPAYQDTGVLYGDRELYARIRKVAEGDEGKTLTEEFEIPIRSGKAWVVKKGSLYGESAQNRWIRKGGRVMWMSNTSFP